jgi:hypothetical protein
LLDQRTAARNDSDTISQPKEIISKIGIAAQDVAERRVRKENFSMGENALADAWAEINAGKCPNSSDLDPSIVSRPSHL